MSHPAEGATGRESINRRLFVIGFLSLLLLIPSGFVGSLIHEREGRRAEVIAEVGGKWGARQTVVGPVLHVPYRRYVKDEKGQDRTTIELATFLPAALDVSGKVEPEVRRRGIYDVVLYRAALKCTGRFGPIRIDEQEVASADVFWERAFLAVGLTDTRGIEERVTLSWNGAPIDLAPGANGSTVAGAGIHARVPLRPGADAGTFAFDLPLRGYDGLSFAPVAARTTVNLRSPWLHPGFVGAFLPERHTGSPEGFTAAWSVLDLNRTFPQQWLGNGPSVDGFAFGVDLVQPVDGYQKSDRAHKYALLLIGLTFLTLLFIELLKQERVQALSYILCGLALCLFYAMLLALSEHVGFDLAYILAALATTALITWHASSVFAQRRLGRAVGGILLVLYGAVFVLLQLKDFALLFGSLGLFAALAGVMAASSRLERR